MTSKLTREKLRALAVKKVKSLKFAITQSAFTNIRRNLEDELQLAEFALAAMDSEPVAYIFKHPAGKLFWALTDESNKGQKDVMPVYADPQPAAVVPDGLVRAVDFYEQVKRENPPVETGAWKDAIDWVLKEACHAAMLQGTENTESGSTIQPAPALDFLPNNAKSSSGDLQAIPGCWCHTCRPVTMGDMRLVVCPECGNKRCPKANDHRNACSGSNEPGQEGSAYPAAPQEVRS
ncbi:TPA: hypothetical protein NOX92_003053 [Escherichia coli]|uniref:hypothetical protein n=1 Tax=Escherichia coli TaxID=562 RepID=UPI00225910E9|nr:hypothetical protein [Escherichia coli]MCX3825172.1 hypothetical protein [Escherichia coli]HCH9731139.1 hypothetical protein [Escherichia coli]HCI3407174.1 hypothetical protein [Escherichia coli]